MKKLLILSIMILVLCIAATADTLSEVQSRSTSSYSSPYATNSIDVTFISQDPDPVEPGKYVTLRFKVENLGTSATEDLYFKLDVDYPFYFDNEEAAVLHVGRMVARQYGDNAAIIKYKVRVDKNAVQGTAYVDLMQYSNNNESDYVKTRNFPISVKTFDSILEVEEIKTVPEKVAPGEKGVFSVKVKNLADSYIDDIRITADYVRAVSTGAGVSIVEIPLTAYSDTNEKSIDHLNSGEEGMVKFNFIADSTAEPKVYKVPLTITYTDASGKNYSKNAVTGIIVGSEPEIIVHISETDLRFAGTKGKVSIEFVNKGLTDVKRVYARLVDNPKQYKILSLPDIYVGNIDSDDYETAEFELYLNNDIKDNAILRLEVEYRDDNNQPVKEQVELNLELFTQSEAKKYGYTDGNGKMGYLIIIIILAIAGFFGWRYWKGKHKKPHHN